jgi:hypothetical protein
MLAMEPPKDPWMLTKEPWGDPPDPEGGKVGKSPEIPRKEALWRTAGCCDSWTTGASLLLNF